MEQELVSSAFTTALCILLVMGDQLSGAAYTASDIAAPSSEGFRKEQSVVI